MNKDKLSGRSRSRARWIVFAILASAVVAVYGLHFYQSSHPEEDTRAYAQAARLTALLRKDPHFSETSAECVGGGKFVVVFASADLAPETKTALENFVRQHAAANLDPHVHYLPYAVSPTESPLEQRTQ